MIYNEYLLNEFKFSNTTNRNKVLKFDIKIHIYIKFGLRYTILYSIQFLLYNLLYF